MKTTLLRFAGGAAVAGAISVAYLAGRTQNAVALFPPLLPALTQVNIKITPAPNVLLATKALDRLETQEMHFERVVNIDREESTLFGLLKGHDRLLLKASGVVTAGVELAALHPDDISTDWPARRVQMTLPKAQIFSAALDASHTQVFSRSTSWLSSRDEQLEGAARIQAEREIRDAAAEAKILEKADAEAQRAVTELLHSLGFTSVVVTSHEGAS